MKAADHWICGLFSILLSVTAVTTVNHSQSIFALFYGMEANVGKQEKPP
jgi:hypothetical protein